MLPSANVAALVASLLAGTASETTSRLLSFTFTQHWLDLSAMKALVLTVDLLTCNLENTFFVLELSVMMDLVLTIDFLTFNLENTSFGLELSVMALVLNVDLLFLELSL